jgi:AAT family amino acid transporter
MSPPEHIEEQSSRFGLPRRRERQASSDSVSSKEAPPSDVKHEADIEKGELGDGPRIGLASANSFGGPNIVLQDKLARKLSARQVQMIAIGGTIGTGLFLGTGKSLATGGPASMLICYIIIGIIVFLTMLALGEMASFIPVAGSFCTFAGRFVDDAFGFALTWNYWFNDAVSTAADLVAVQLVLSYWETKMPGWGLSLIFWGVLVAANIISVRAYGELEYWLSLLKVITIIVGLVPSVIRGKADSTDLYLPGHCSKCWWKHRAPLYRR